MILVRTLVVTVALLLVMGCGGSGTGPEVSDLTGLEGVWDFTSNMQGSFDFAGDNIPISDNYTGFMTVTKTTVIDNEGTTYSWTYDGVTLILKSSDSITESDPDCGNMYMNGNETDVIKVIANQTVANLNGTLTGTITSQFCGNGTFHATATGTITKR